MKKIFININALFISLIFLLSLILSWGCKGMKDTAFQVPGDYKKWKKPVARVLDYEVPGHGKSFRIIYANKEAFQGKKGRAGDPDALLIPDGAIIVKESYLKRGDIKKYNYRDLTIMLKASSDPKALDGWRYFVKKKDKPIKEVSGRMCIGCHEAANEPHPYFDGNKKGAFRDYLFAPFK